MIAPSTAHHSAAMRMLAAGPASATHIIARRGWRSTLVAVGTGFAHPNTGPPTASIRPGTRTVPMGSMWRRGFKLKRPSNSAVRSPKYLAIHPCATSCRVMAISTGITQIETFLRNAFKSNAYTRFLENTRSLEPTGCAHREAALYGGSSRKGAYVAATHAHHNGAIAG